MPQWGPIQTCSTRVGPAGRELAWRWRRGRGLLLALVLLNLGCGQGFLVRTDSCMRMEGPMRFTMYSPAGPVVPMRVGPQDCPADKGMVAVVDIDGLLLNEAPAGLAVPVDNPVALLDEKLDAVAHAPGVRAVVLRLNSPGGSVAATELMYRRLLRFRSHCPVPVVAAVLDVGTGGAYYLATAADRIVCQPGSITGAIGVTINLFNLRETMASLNILDQSIKAGEQTDMGTSRRALSPEAAKQLQRIANSFHARFKQVVVQARPQLLEAPAEVFDGRIFSGDEAQNLGLVDQLGDLPDAIQLARELAHCPQAGVCLLHRCEDKARSAYAITPAVTLPNLVPANVPGLNRTRLPVFLYLWQPDPIP